MTKFIALYLAPAKVIEDWSKTDPDKRKPIEEKMREDWMRWMDEHAAMVTQTEAGGKTKRVSADGISDVKNEVMLYSFVEAESHATAAQAFATHPHLRIPQSSIEIMEVRSMTGG